jgi:hypothetical protein
MERRGPCQNCGKTSMPDDSANLVQVEFTPEFKRNLRQLTKKYRHLQADVQPVIAQLESGQTPGTQIPRTGYTVFKVRIKNFGYPKGEAVGISHDLLPQDSKACAVDHHLFQNGTGRCLGGANSPCYHRV